MGKADLISHKEEVIDKYVNQKISTVKLAEEYNTYSSVVSRFLKENGIKTRGHSEAQRIYKINENFLNNIDTEEKAYWLGFFFADGYNNGKGRILIRISSVDAEILYKLRDIMGSNAPIKPIEGKINTNGYLCNDTVALEVHSVKLSEKLSELGAVPGKSYVLKFPDFLPENMYRPFIRGYFDGDGSITKREKNHAGVKFTSSNIFLFELNNYILKELGFSFNVSEHLYNTDERIGDIYINSQGKVRTFLDWLYKDANIYLERKHKRYKLFCDGKELPRYD